MANTCKSIVRIIGLAESIDSFRGIHCPDGILDTSIGLNKMRELHPDYAYTFSDADARLMDYMHEDATLTLYVDSSWNEPIDWLQGIIALHPELTFDVSWAGYEDQFVGDLQGTNGVVTKHQIRCEDDLTEEDRFILGMEDDVVTLAGDDDKNDEEPSFGQCGKCGDWITFPCYNCQARKLEGGK